MVSTGNLYVITHTHQQYMEWCSDQGIDPRRPDVIEVGPWNHERVLLGTSGARYVWLPWYTGAPLIEGLSFELMVRQAVPASDADVREFARRSCR